ncbi:MAG: flagellar protein FliS [Cellulosilyticaceae bacterium]
MKKVTETNIPYASQGELLCTTYEIFLEQISGAQKLEGRQKQKCVEVGIEIIKQLVEGLDFKIKISRELFRIYVYIQGLLINHKYNETNLKEAYQLMEMIYIAYKQIVETGAIKTPAMSNVETIYAGVTYGRGTLNEMVMPNTNRGFRA